MPKVKIPQNISDWFKAQGLDKMLTWLELEQKITPVFLVNPEGYEGYVRDPYRSYRHQPDGLIVQANPVSGTKYTVLDTTLNVRPFLLEGYSVKIEAEITGGTVSNLTVRAKYATLP